MDTIRFQIYFQLFWRKLINQRRHGLFHDNRRCKMTWLQIRRSTIPTTENSSDWPFSRN